MTEIKERPHQSFVRNRRGAKARFTIHAVYDDRGGSMAPVFSRWIVLILFNPIVPADRQHGRLGSSERLTDDHDRPSQNLHHLDGRDRIFSDGAYDSLLARCDPVIGANPIARPSNRIDVSPLLWGAVACLAGSGKAVS